MYKWMLSLLCIPFFVQANCQMYFKDKIIEKNLGDHLYNLLVSSDSCPQSIQALRKIFREKGLEEHIAMVANRGRNNPNLGSFSFFESIDGQLNPNTNIQKGELYLGYFTGLDNMNLILDQSPEEGKLLIEAISWDAQNQHYHFYELRGIQAGGTRWYYRGNSEDAYKDNQWLFRDSPQGKEHFGKRMRCSACHNSGGPILKELAPPHNDWWSMNRPLIFQPNAMDADVAELVDKLVDAEVFAKDVKRGMDMIKKSPNMKMFKKNLSMQEQMRPLFCTSEINIESSSESADATHLTIPSGFWLNPILGQFYLKVPSKQYEQALEQLNMSFPETNLRDADHRWLTPVKGVADIEAIEQLIANGEVRRDFAIAVMMFDFTHPVFSVKRCELLKLVPNSKENWEIEFKRNLDRYGDDSPDVEALRNTLKTSQVNLHLLSNKIKFYELLLLNQLSTGEGVNNKLLALDSLRNSVKENELSKNPLGQILEPGFRVIFPERSAD